MTSSLALIRISKAVGRFLPVWDWELAIRKYQSPSAQFSKARLLYSSLDQSKPFRQNGQSNLHNFDSPSLNGKLHVPTKASSYNPKVWCCATDSRQLSSRG